MRKQLKYMKSYGIWLFAYNWFMAETYYYHLKFWASSKILYPEGMEKI